MGGTFQHSSGTKVGKLPGAPVVPGGPLVAHVAGGNQTRQGGLRGKGDHVAGGSCLPVVGVGDSGTCHRSAFAWRAGRREGGWMSRTRGRSGWKEAMTGVRIGTERGVGMKGGGPKGGPQGDPGDIRTGIAAHFLRRGV